MSWMLAENKVFRSELRTWLLMANSTNFMFTLVLHSPGATEVTRDSPGRCCAHGWLAWQLRNPETTDPEAFIMDSKSGWNFPRGRHYHYYTGQEANLPPVLERDTLSIFQGYLLFKHPWKDSLGQKLSMPIPARCAEIRSRYCGRWFSTDLISLLSWLLVNFPTSEKLWLTNRG